MNRLVVFFNDRDTEGTQEGGEWSYRNRDSEGTGVNVGAWWCVPAPSVHAVRRWPTEWCVPVAGVQEGGEWSYRNRDSEGTGVNVGAWWCVPAPSVHAVRRWRPEWCVPVAGRSERGCQVVCPRCWSGVSDGAGGGSASEAWSGGVFDDCFDSLRLAVLVMPQ